MKSIIRQIVPYLLIGTLILLFLSIRSCSNQRREKSSFEKLLNLTKDSLNKDVKFWKDKSNQEHATVERVKLEKEAMQYYADSLAKVLKIKSKQVEEITTVKSKLKYSGKLSKDTVYRDSLVYIKDTSGNVVDSSITKIATRINFSKIDSPWIKIKGSVGDRDSIEVSGIDTLVKVDYWKRKWLLGQKRYYSDITNKNPYIHIEGYRVVELRQARSPILTIGPSIQLGYPINNINWRKSQLQIGISIQYTPLSIKLK